MGSAVVPWKRTETPMGDIQVGLPVRSQTWQEVALLLHWLRAHGMHLIPAHAPHVYLTNSTVVNLEYRIKPQGLGILRVWIIALRQQDPANPPTAATVSITLPGGSSFTAIPGVASAFGAGQHIFVETVAKSSAETAIQLSVQRTAGTSQVWIESVSCFELPRAVLTEDTTDRGVDLITLRPGQPLTDRANESIGSIVSYLQDAVSWPRRMLWQQSLGAGAVEVDPGGASNPTSWTDLTVLPCPMLPRKVAVGDTSFDVTWDVLVNIDSGTTFEIRATTTNSATADTVTEAGTGSTTWMGTSTIALDCEDPGAVDGLPNLGNEGVTVAVRRTVGAGKGTFHTLSFFEAS